MLHNLKTDIRKPCSIGKFGLETAVHRSAADKAMRDQMGDPNWTRPSPHTWHHSETKNATMIARQAESFSDFGQGPDDTPDRKGFEGWETPLRKETAVLLVLE